MAQIIEKKPDPTIQALGTGLGSGLQSLMNMKMQEMQQRKVGSGLASILGISPEQGYQLSNLPPQILNQIVQERLQAPKQERFAKAQAAASGLPMAADTPQGVGQASPQEAQPAISSQMPGTQIMQQAQGQGAPESFAGTQSMDTGQAVIPDLTGISPQQASAVVKTALDRQKMQQREKLEEIKSTRRVKEAAFKDALKSAEGSRQKIEVSKDSYRSNADALRLLNTGRVDTDLLFKLKDWAEIDKIATTPETQAVAKILAAEPIRSLSVIPGQAARLSKVFDTIKDMTPSLMNTPDGLRFIAKIRMADSKATKLFHEAKLDEEERLTAAGQRIPFNIDKIVARKIQPKLDKQYRAVEELVASRIGSDDPRELPSNFKLGEIRRWPQNDLAYRVEEKNGKKIWAPFKLLKKKPTEQGG